MDQNLEDAHDVDDAIVCLLLKRGASGGVIKIVEGVAAAAVTGFGTRIRNPGEISIDAEDLARVVLKANLKAMERELDAHLRNKPVVFVWIAKLVFFRKWQAFKEFKRIVEGL